MDNHTSPALPPDDLLRKLTLARPNQDAGLPHIGVVGDTYTILLTGERHRWPLLPDRHAYPSRRRPRLRTATTLRRPSYCSKASSRPPSGAPRPSSGLGKPSTSPPTLHISFTTPPAAPSASCASAPPPARRTSSARSASRSQHAPRLHRRSMTQPKPPLPPNPKPSLRSTIPNSSSTPERLRRRPTPMHRTPMRLPIAASLFLTTLAASAQTPPSPHHPRPAPQRLPPASPLRRQSRRPVPPRTASQTQRRRPRTHRAQHPPHRRPLPQSRSNPNQPHRRRRRYRPPALRHRPRPVHRHPPRQGRRRKAPLLPSPLFQQAPRNR